MTVGPPGCAPGCLVIVCGLPGSGRTTLATRLAAERGGIRMCPDDWLDALGVNLWDAAARERVEALQWTLTRDLLALGVTVIIEWGTWGRSERDTLRDGARALRARVELVLLDVAPQELWRRVQARSLEDPPVTLEQLSSWYAAFQRPDDGELTSYDAWSVCS